MRIHAALLTGTASIVVIGLTATPARADLEVLQGGLAVYDTDRDITWVADANLCLALGNCVNGNVEGGMRWVDALKWAYELDYLGYRDWRLPSSLELDGSGPCQGYCSGSEMGHVFYMELDGTAGAPLTNFGPFTNIQIGEYTQIKRYWSREHIGINSPVAARTFNFQSGQQGLEVFGGDDDFLFAWAVRDGKIEDASTLADLIDKVSGVGAGKSLEMKLTAAQMNAAATCGALGAFVHEVNALSGNLLDPALADELIDDATAIAESAGCD